MQRSDMEPIKIAVLIGCDCCNSPQVQQDNFYCDACLISDCKRQIQSYQNKDYLSPDFRERMLKEYEDRLAQLEARASFQPTV